MDDNHSSYIYSYMPNHFGVKGRMKIFRKGKISFQWTQTLQWWLWGYTVLHSVSSKCCTFWLSFPGLLVLVMQCNCIWTIIMLLTFITKCHSSAVDLSSIAGNIVQVTVGWGCINKEAGHLLDLTSRMTFRLERRTWRTLNIWGDYGMKPRQWKKHNGNTSLLE